jgi:hypothetical protein
VVAHLSATIPLPTEKRLLKKELDKCGTLCHTLSMTTKTRHVSLRIRLDLLEEVDGRARTSRRSRSWVIQHAIEILAMSPKQRRLYEEVGEAAGFGSSLHDPKTFTGLETRSKRQ